MRNSMSRSTPPVQPRSCSRIRQNAGVLTRILANAATIPGLSTPSAWTIATALIALTALPAFAQQWGSVKGQIVWDKADPVPAAATQNVTKDQGHCLAKGPLAKDDVLIDAKSLGVKNVMIWLADTPAGGVKNIHPTLVAVPKDAVVIDQPMCGFVPRITMMRAGQSLEVHNSAPIAHNARIAGNPDINPTINLLIPPGGKSVRDGDKALKAEKRPLLLACDIHGWMGGRIGVFDHPYFAVTKEDGTFEIKNAPAGNILIFLQHERAGWVHEGRTSKGYSINIPAGGSLDLKMIPFKADFLKD